jgi:hypothetical protein
LKRVVSSSIIALLLIGLLGAGFFYFNRYSRVSDRAINAIPPDAAFFIDYCSDADNLKKLINSNFFADSRLEPALEKISGSLVLMDSMSGANKAFHEVLQESHLLVSAHVTKAADFDLLYLMSLPAGNDEKECEEWLKLFAGNPSAALQSRNYDGVRILELPLSGGSTFTFTVTKGVFVGSFTSFLVEDAIRQQKLKKPMGGDKTFLSLYEKQFNAREDRIYIKYYNLPKWLNVFTDPDKNNAFNMLSNFGEWTSLAVHVEKEHIQLSGIETATDTNDFIQVFHNQIPVEINLPEILPSKTAAFCYYGMSNSKSYFQDLKRYLDKKENGYEKDRYLNTLDAAYKVSIRDKMQSWIGNEYAFVVTEPGGTNYDNNVLAAFSATDTLKALKNLRELARLIAIKQQAKITEEKYNGHVIGLINVKDVMQALYGDVFKRLNKMFFTTVKGYVIFSNQASALRSFIDDFENRSFLFSDDDKNIIKKQSTNGNFCFYSRIPACQYIFKSVASRQAIATLDKYKALSQWDGFSFLVKKSSQGCEVLSYLQYAQKPASGVNLVWAAELDTVISAGPFFVHTGAQQNSVMVQDGQFNLYMLDNAGNIKWKKILHEPIMGEVHVMDIFRNNQVQILFNTASSLEMIDADGNNVSNFPIRLPDIATNGSAVFDYDNTGEYRIYVACSNGRVYGYQSSGKPLPGWNFNAPAGIINEPLRHFKRKDLDYLVFSDHLGQVFIVSKMGDAIINVKQKLFTLPGNLFYLSEDTENNYSFVTSDTAGNLCQIMPDGFIRVHPVATFNNAPGFVMTDLDHNDQKDFLFNDGTQIQRYEKDSLSMLADLSKLTAGPHLILLNYAENNVKLGTWSDSSDKIYLFNADGTVYKGFPVKGNRRFYMDEINIDGRKNILTGSGKEVLLYVLE